MIEDQLKIEGVAPVEHVEPVENTEAEDALLAELDADFDPTEAVESHGVDEAKQAAAEATALMAMTSIEGILKQFAHKDVVISDEQKQGTAEALKPLLVKYNGQMPPWMEQYKEEIAAVVAVGVLGFGVTKQVKQLKAMDKAKLVNDSETETDGA